MGSDWLRILSGGACHCPNNQLKLLCTLIANQLLDNRGVLHPLTMYSGRYPKSRAQSTVFRRRQPHPPLAKVAQAPDTHCPATQSRLLCWRFSALDGLTTPPFRLGQCERSICCTSFPSSNHRMRLQASLPQSCSKKRNTQQPVAVAQLAEKSCFCSATVAFAVSIASYCRLS